jgi:LysM repeat protein
VCPHCGRDVHPAGPRWGVWLVGFAVIAFAALWGLGELPIERIKTEVASVRTRVASVVQVLGPAAGPSREATPRPTQAAIAAANTRTATPTSVALPTKRPTEILPTITPLGEITATVSVTGTVAATATVSLPALTPTPEPTATATAAPTATPTPEPTATPAPEPTATQTQPPAPSGRVTYKVQSGDTLSSIAAKYGITWQDLAQANGLNSRSTLRVGQELVIPGKGGAVAPPPPTAASAPTKYVVKSGDTLSSIAARYGITWQELAQANGLTSSSRLRVGQELIVPVKGAPQAAAPTATAARPTAAPPTPTAAPAALLPAPELLSPGDQTPFSGSGSFIELVWSKADDLPAGAGYRVSIRWIEEGAPMEYLVPVTTATSIRMPSWLFGKADQPARQYTWSVRIVRTTTDGQGGEKDLLLSPSSVSRVLYWN